MKADSLAEALTNGRGVERSFRCEMHDDRNASASVNTITGLWVCFACGAAGKVDESATIPDAEQLLAYLKGDIPPRIHPEAWLDLFDMHHPSPYWVKRFGERVATYFRCGTDPLTGKPTYPIRDCAGNVLGVVTRSQTNPKYMYPHGVSTSRTFFGDIRPNPVVVLVEGAADVMALHQAGIPSGWTVLGCYGAGIHQPQQTLVVDLAPKVIIAAFDNDAAGDMAAQRTIARLAHIAPVIKHTWQHNDPGDMAVEARIETLQQTLVKEKQ